MTDQQSEGDQNLRDILGFDPNETSSLDFPEVKPSTHPERRDWPENWREMFIDQLNSPLADYVDIDNLFIVSKPFSVNKAWGESIQRDYYVFDPESTRKRKFQKISSVVIPSERTDDGYFSFQTSREGEYSEHIRISFNPKAVQSELSPIEILKLRVGRRDVQIDYDENGGILSTSLTVNAESSVSDSEGMPDVFSDPYVVSLYKYLNNEWRIGGEIESLGDIEYEEFPDENRLVLRRIENGEVKDEMEMPLKIDPEKLKQKWLGKKLLDDPGNHDTQLDENWRGVDFFHDAGLRWDAVADDSFHSLSRSSDL